VFEEKTVIAEPASLFLAGLASKATMTHRLMEILLPHMLCPRRGTLQTMVGNWMCFYCRSAWKRNEVLKEG